MAQFKTQKFTFFASNTVILNEKSALILEGGGLRGVFTCGVLDNFMDRGIKFPFAIGVSAGACNGLSYMSGQRGRAKFSNIDLLDKYGYIGLKYLFTQRNIMDFKLLFDKFPNEIIPYDYPAYAANPNRFVMVTTSCITGKAVYHEEKHDKKRIMEIVTASSSMPYVSQIVDVDGIPMLDGGIADSIPVEFAMEHGFTNNIVVLTRNRGYRKKVSGPKLYNRLLYRKYPKLQEAIINRNRNYNRVMELVEKMEDEGKLTVIRPLKPLQVDRIEKNTAKLIDLYNEGYQIAQNLVFEM